MMMAASKNYLMLRSYDIVKFNTNNEVTVKPVKTDQEEEKKLPAKKFPKRKLAMVVGYNGSKVCQIFTKIHNMIHIQFQGSQKNNDIRSVELELEKALYANGMIDPRNFGDLKKIGFSRATRTDKSVHALHNYF